MAVKKGNQTYEFTEKIYLKDTAAVVGPREKEGPLGEYFDEVQRESFEDNSWEKAEAKFTETVFEKLNNKVLSTGTNVDCVLAGDLMNQCIASSIGLRNSGVSYLGLFGACSTIVEGLSVGAFLIDSKAMSNIMCIASSNFCSAEKTFRMPLEQGGQRPPTAQCTVSAAGGVWLSSNYEGPFITHATVGKIVDYNITDANNMGAAMAPAAADTIIAHLKDINAKPSHYDAIITGDLGITGSGLLCEIMDMHGYSLNDKNISIHKDCGAMIFDSQVQKTNSGGSGCGCISSVFAKYFFRKLQEKKLKKILLVGTGALMSSVSVKQSESISGIAHAVSIEVK